MANIIPISPLPFSASPAPPSSYLPPCPLPRGAFASFLVSSARPPSTRRPRGSHLYRSPVHLHYRLVSREGRGRYASASASRGASRGGGGGREESREGHAEDWGLAEKEDEVDEEEEEKEEEEQCPRRPPPQAGELDAAAGAAIGSASEAEEEAAAPQRAAAATEVEARSP